MTLDETGITADAKAIQERDAFRAAGWLKLIAPAKVNLFLGIGAKRPDGYHDVCTVMHALLLHDIMYMRRRTPADEGFGTEIPEVRIIPSGGFEVPPLPNEDNLAAKAVIALREKLREKLHAAPDFCDLVIRIEKKIPLQGGLGGASTNAAAALMGAALLNDVALDDPAIELAARELGADVAFFLHGGCSFFEGAGDIFRHTLKPASTSVALIKPAEGVSTPLAYCTFDEDPVPIDSILLDAARNADAASDVPLFNNLAPAAEMLLPELREIRLWAESQRGVTNALLCGSGATTFALCDSMDSALGVVAQAQKLGWWARATSLSSIGVRALGGGE